jgi:hypothetical protein
MATTYLTFTTGSAGNRLLWTWSGWVKKTDLTANGTLFFAGGSNSDYSKILLSTNGALYISEVGGGSTVWEVQTNRLFRDPSAYYHMVFVYDSAQSTASDRLKIYINGVQETSFAVSSYPAQNRGAMWLAGGTDHRIGRDYVSQYFGGIISDINFSDGYAYGPETFGETDTDTGEWRIKDNPSFSLGTYGFTILKNGNTITDQSTNSNNWSLGGGTLTNTLDCPANVFSTLNPLANVIAPVTLSEGNLKIAMTNSKGGNLSTISCTGGKYYAEMKIATAPQDFRFHWGIMPHPVIAADDPINAANAGIMLSGFNAVIYAANGIINSFYGNATGRFSGNPIMGLAIDLESATRTMAISINGAWVTGSNATDTDFSNALKVDITSYVASYPNWFIGCGSGNGSGTTGVYELNFGNGYFGTTAVSSAGTPGSTPGTFEYDVPSGYEPLTTKGLNA